MKNVVAIGAVLKMLGIDIRAFDDVVRIMFGRKGEDVVNSNVKAAGVGYSYAGVTTLCSFKMDGKSRRIIDGNAALALGAYAGGCKLYAAYPMTPASTIMHWFASHENKGVMLKQTEDEITAINTAIGASATGVRAMCGTSGGGFSLMVEALGLAGMLETPLVVVDSQRTGPSTGLPAKTEQADMFFAMHASQGEFPRIVVAPRSVEECFYSAADAFNLADRYQCPVIILLDQFLSEHTETVDDFNLDLIKIDRGKLLTSTEGAAIQNGKFKRYLYTADGVSPRPVFGVPGLEHIAPSDEHDEFGNLVSDALSGLDEYVAVRKKMNEKRMSKIDTMLKTETIFHPNMDRQDADYYFVTWGSSTLAVSEAATMLNSQGLKFGVISFNYVMPLDKNATKSMLAGKKLIDVECNFTAQLAQLIMLNTGIDVKDRILRYDGEALTSNEVVSKALEIIKR
jgi:2-oxoglutarate ferredoxin oxidoreductase subunit alpha